MPLNYYFVEQLQKNNLTLLRVHIENIISIRDKSQSILIKDVKFELKSNQIFSIVGRNGSGKTTFIKSLTGLLDKRFYTTNGKVEFEGLDLLTLDSKSLQHIRKSKIKYVFQDAKNSFNQLKKFDHYFQNDSVDKAEIDRMLNYFLLPKSTELFKLHPYEVSGGMAQRISLALVLLAHPSLIILDEPTSGVDSAIANLFLLKLKDFVKNNSASVILVTQDLNFAEKISDKISLLADSTLKEFLPPADFYTDGNVSSDDLIKSYLQIAT